MNGNSEPLLAQQPTRCPFHEQNEFKQRGNSGEDDDGMAGGAATIDDAQSAEIEKLITDVAADRAGFLKYMKAASVSEIKNVDYPKAISALKAKGAKK